MTLSERVRPGSEAATWVCDEIRQLEQERDELAAQVEVMHAQWCELMGVLADIQNGNGFDDACRSTISRVVYVLAQTNTAADILRQRDARVIRQFAAILLQSRPPLILPFAERYAKELERKNG